MLKAIIRRSQIAVLASSVLFTGCAVSNVGPTAIEIEDRSEVTSAAEMRALYVRENTRDYLREVLAKTKRLDEYKLTFIRTEKRGLIKTMRQPERIAAWYRQEPFSVRMKWLDDDVKYGESMYIRGAHDDKLRYVPRKGLFGMKPSVNTVDVQLPVSVGEARNPITDFGLQRLMERTVNTMEANAGDAKVSYEGLKKLPENEQLVHHIRLEYLPSKYPTPIQELFIDVETDLPAATVLRDRGGNVEARYVYLDIDRNVDLSDEDFELEFLREQQASSGAAGGQAAHSTPQEQSAS